MPKHSLRIFILCISLASIVGVGCVVIPISADKDRTADSVYRPKAERGDPVAALQLALAYRFGTAGVDKDEKAAWQWLTKAAEAGSMEARMMRAEALWRGDLGQSRQPAVALAAMTQLAGNGTSEQQAHLAALLEGDLGGEAQPAEAALWYEKAARRGHRYAAQRLGLLLETGQIGRQDKVMALAWYRVAKADTDISRLEAALPAGDRKRAAALAEQILREIQP